MQAAVILIKNNVKYSDSDAESKAGYGDIYLIETMCDKIEFVDDKVIAYNKKTVIATYNKDLVIGWYAKQSRLDNVEPHIGEPDITLD